MRIRFVLVTVALLAWLAVDARPQPGTTGGKHNDDLDGIGADLEDFLKHRDQTNANREAQNVYNTNRNTPKRPTSSGGSFLDDLLKGGGLSSLGGLGGLGGLTRPSAPSRPAPAPARPSSSSSGSRYPSSSPSGASVPSYPSYPSLSNNDNRGGSSRVPVGGGWVAPSSGGDPYSGSAPKKQGGGASYPSYPSNYPSNNYPSPNYPGYPSYPTYTNYQRGNPNPYPSYPTYQQQARPQYQQPAYNPTGLQQQLANSGYQSVKVYDPRNPPPPQKKSSSSGGISGFFKKIFS